MSEHVLTFLEIFYFELVFVKVLFSLGKLIDLVLSLLLEQADLLDALCELLFYFFLLSLGCLHLTD
jgi:hypothetical protein